MNETLRQTSRRRHYDVSCLVTFHSEGYLAHRTLTSISMCRDYAEKRGLSAELVLVLDNADPVTESAVAGHFALRKDDQILRVNNRSAPLSRNDGIKAARGEFISIHDGDDYYSENLVYEGVTFCKSKPRSVVHVGTLIEFESKYCAVNYYNTKYTLYDFVSQHPLISESIASKDIYLRIPYQPTGNGFGYEDWHWNAETTAAGYAHVCLPHTFLFYRRKRQKSLLARESAAESLIRPTRLFDQLDYPVKSAAPDAPSAGEEAHASADISDTAPFPAEKPSRLYSFSKASAKKLISKLPEDLQTPAKECALSFLTLARSIKDHVKNRRRLRRRSAARNNGAPEKPSRLYSFSKASAKKLISKLPEDLQTPAKECALSFLTLARSTKDHVKNRRQIRCRPAVKDTGTPENASQTDIAECTAALKKISLLDSSLHPASNPPLHEWHFVSDDRLGRLFALLYNPLRGQRYDMAYIVPWLIRGGADLMTINFANALAEQGKKVLVISTLPVLSTWRGRLAEEVDFLDLGNAAGAFSNEEHKLLLARLLLQLQPKAAHCMLSQLGYETFASYAPALRQYMKLYAAFYADEKRSDGSDVGYISRFLTAMLPSVSAVTTDNAVMPQVWHRKYGAPLELLRTVYGRMDFNAGAAPLCSGRSVLWAGRFHPQKRPELLLETVKKMPKVHFFIYGEPDTEDTRPLYNSLASLPNVTLGGRYDSFASLPVKDCFCLLYTSSYDGLPNVLLEAAAAGLPAAAPDIGGISDFINAQTGWLLKRDATADDYVKTIEEMRSAPELCQTKVAAAQKLLRQRHNKAAFKTSIVELYGFNRS